MTNSHTTDLMVFARRSRLQLPFLLLLCISIVASLCASVSLLLCQNDDGLELAGSRLIPTKKASLATVKNSRLLVTVPFYVYEEIAWMNATFGNISVAELSHSPHRNKHADDYFFMKASLEHPMRTLDPSEAKIFVIPLLLNMFADRHYYAGKEFRLCHKFYCDRELLRQAERVLQNSEYFHSSPEKHIVVRSHYLASHGFQLPKELKAMLQKVNTITFENQIPNDPHRLRFPKLYVGSPCDAYPPNEEKPFDMAMIASVNYNKLHYFEDRLRICEWIQSPNATIFPRSNQANTTSNIPLPHHDDSTTNTFRVSRCGRGEQCPSLAQSKFGFHTRGDTFGSNRLFDTILSGTVPIFTRKEQYDILPNWIDWNQLSFYVPISNVSQSNFVSQLRELTRNKTEYNQKYRSVLQHRELLDWKTCYPFDMYLYQLQAQLYPETRHFSNTTAWPALRLPPILST